MDKKNNRHKQAASCGSYFRCLPLGFLTNLSWILTFMVSPDFLAALKLH
jgi:hypothetical protein